MQNKIIRQYYLLSGLFRAGGLSIISAIYVSYLIKNGLNLFEANLVNAAFFFTLFICEIPTGAFADTFGRKRSFVAACLIMGTSMTVYGLSSSFAGFVAAEVIAGIGYTFESGAFKAWLVDSLKHHRYEGDLSRVFGRASLVCQIGGGAGAVIGSYTSAIHASLPWFIGAVTLGVTAVLAASIMDEEYFVRKSLSWKSGLKSMKETAATSIRYGREHKAVRFVLIMTGVQILALQPLNMYWQPFFRDNGLAERHLGWAFAAILVMIALGTFIASKVKAHGREKKIIVGLASICGILAIVAASVNGLPLILAFYLLHEVPRGAWGPYLDSYLQARIPSGERATITSFTSMAPHIGGAIGLVLSGIIAERFGISTSWVVAGILLIAGSLMIAKNGDHGPS